MRRRSGFTSRRPKLDVLENRNLMSGVIPSAGAPPHVTPPAMMIVGHAPFAGVTPGFGSGVTASGSLAGADSSWNPAIFGGRPGGYPQNGWGGSFDHGSEGASLTVEVAAPTIGPAPSMAIGGGAPRGTSGNPSASFAASPGPTDGPMMMFMAKGGPFGDAFSRKGPEDGFPPIMRGRDFPFAIPPRGLSLSRSMLGLQFAQDQAVRGVESEMAAVSPSPGADPPATADVDVRSTEPVGQPSPGFGFSSPLGLSMITDEPTTGRVLELDSIVLPGQAAAADLDRVGVANDAPLDEADDSDQLAAAESEPEEVLEPHAAGLMARVLPFDQRSLEEAVDQFLDQLHELNVDGYIEPSPIRVIVASAAVVGAGVAVEAGRRRLSPRRRRGRLMREWDANENEELLGFPELPGSWSARWV